MFAAIIAFILYVLSVLLAPPVTPEPIPEPTPAPTPALIVALTRAPVFDAEIVRLNAVRDLHGLVRFTRVTNLDLIAGLRAYDLASGAHAFSHYGPDGSISYLKLGSPISTNSCEILAYNNYVDPIGRSIDLWLNSPTHAACLLGPKYRYAGVESRISSDGVTYSVVIFSE